MGRIAPALILLLASSLSFGHGPTRQKVTESITIKASPARVWDKIKDFNSLPGWHPAVEGSKATDGSNVGSVRTLSLKGGGEVVETLESYSDAERKFSYRAKDGGALPVTNYTSSLSVRSGEGGASVVEWRGAFYRAFPNNNPPPGQDDEAAVKAITGVYTSGLSNLKKLLE